MSLLPTANTDNDRDRSRLIATVLAVGIVVLGAGLRLACLTRAPVWVDEAYSYHTAIQTVPEILTTLRGDNGPPLYYLLLHYWISLTGGGTAPLRLLSVASSVILIWAVYRAGRRLISRQVGLLGAFLLAISPIQIYYSQEIRMYALLQLTAFASFYFLIRFCQERRLSYFVYHATATLLCLYTHNYAFFLIAAEWALLLVSGLLPGRWKDFLALAAVIAMGYLPWLPSFLSQLNNPGFAWYALFWQQWGPLGAASRTIQLFAIGGRQPIYVGLQATAWGGTVPAWLASGCVLFGLARLYQNKPSAGRLELFWLPVYLFTPLLLSLVTSMVMIPNYMPGRVDQLVFPAFCLLMGFGVAAIPRHWLRSAIIAVVVLNATQTLAGYYQQSYAHSDRELASYVESISDQNTMLLCTALTRASLAYYLREDKREMTTFSYPRATATHLGYQNHPSLLDKTGRQHQEAQSVLTDIRAGLGQNSGRLVVVVVANRVNTPLLEVIRQNDWLHPLGKPVRFRQSVTNLPILVFNYAVDNRRRPSANNDRGD